MEKQIGSINIVITDKESAEQVNQLLSANADMIYSRNGMPLREEQLFIISLIVKSTADNINAFTGKLGRIKGVKVRSILIKTI
ncbi:MAG: hypothetical protein J5606_09505 [Bacteroidales bacterium]|nr:hypothetical protein [Bacteroidales bacterium]